ncbi:hypothetical protein [Nocardioides lianchengensis]|uniref:Uncharacterized protein n=1 Tax=Nocardioides lianchengensis TaxID=1045774 RepID=A0A1G6LU80_9ACTN|nr:hypothetical protein [Nocardioides lianchengensis]NYG12456.1 hypothetical protein [Nocardioides lianchengensis]SDC46256.1 hypothetical protein SAMN05421872_102348 [Nocardioides lianchengensis]
MGDEFEADQHGYGEPSTTGEVEAAPGSVLESIRARRDRAKSVLFIDIKVPRYDPPVWVRFKPTEQKRIDGAGERARKSKDDDRTVIANAAILAEACIGVFEVVDDDKVSIDPTDRSTDPADWPKFDKRLARLLEIPAGKATDVVRGLYLTDGDIISTAADLGEWSGYARDMLEQDTEGN